MNLRNVQTAVLSIFTIYCQCRFMYVQLAANQNWNGQQLQKFENLKHFDSSINIHLSIFVLSFVGVVKTSS